MLATMRRPGQLSLSGEPRSPTAHDFEGIRDSFDNRSPVLDAAQFKWSAEGPRRDAVVKSLGRTRLWRRSDVEHLGDREAWRADGRRITSCT